MRLSSIKNMRPGIIDRRDEARIMALSIYCASMYGGATPLPVEVCVTRARELSDAVNQSFEAELHAADEQRIQMLREDNEKAEKMKKARIEIYGKDEDEE